MGTNPPVDRPVDRRDPAAIRAERQCQSYTVRGQRCKRAGVCWSEQSGRHCVQHMREVEPGSAFWLM